MNDVCIPVKNLLIAVLIGALMWAGIIFAGIAIWGALT